jgi:preprotein translocase subunit SecD
VATPTGQPRTSRYIIALLVIIAGLYGLVFFTGNGKAEPRLGLDLIGGTTVRLTAVKPGGGAPEQSQLQLARDIIDNRVNGLGVAEPEVVTEGNNQIVISVPGEDDEGIKRVGQPAELRFREVLQTQPDTGEAPEPSPTPSAPAPSGSAPAPSGSPSAKPSGSATAQPASSGSGGGGGLPAAPQPSPAPSGSAPASPNPSASASPSGSASPAPPSGDAAKLPADIQQLVPLIQQAQPEQLAQASQAGALKPFEDLTGAQINALPADVQYKVPEITCKKLNSRPAASIVDPKKQVAACDDGNKYLLDKAAVLGTDVNNSKAEIDQQGGGWKVTLSFKSDGQDKWTNLTKKTVNKQVAVVLDNEVVSAPNITQVITGDAEITGRFSAAEAKTLASQLKYGALPLTFTQSEAQTISPTLGTEQLKAGLLAAAVGMALVAVYAFFYYRLLGSIIFISLIFSALLVFAALVLLGRGIGFTLTLAGVAGFIVSLGVAADSFVIYFERLKDEIRDGRTPRSAVPRAWARARRTIISANAVSFLAAAVLYVLALGAVKGFAFALGLATLLDLVVVFIFRHPIMAGLARTKAFLSPRVSGLGRVLEQAADDEDDGAGRRRPARTREA